MSLITRTARIKEYLKSRSFIKDLLSIILGTICLFGVSLIRLPVTFWPGWHYPNPTTGVFFLGVYVVGLFLKPKKTLVAMILFFIVTIILKYWG
jgi:hypothetical protein